MTSPILPGTVLQRLILPVTTETAGLYLRQHSKAGQRRAASQMAPGAVVDLDTYFNSFDETVWRRHTCLGELAVTVTLLGTCRVQLWRHSRYTAPALLAEISGTGTLRLHVPMPPHPRSTGRLALQIINDAEPGDTGSPARLLGGAWTTDTVPQDIRLMPVLCTFDRDGALCDLIERIAADADAAAALAGLVIVNNGPPGLAARLATARLPNGLGRRVHIVEQPNAGDAGGFTRGMLEARGLGATHVILMDDDVAVEPEAILRTLRFYSLATGELAIAGHMLDLFRPTHLYEAGARLNDAKLALVPMHLGAEMATPGALDCFLHDQPMHYNGWWFMGLPLSLVARVGLPMPCFIRGDDVEYGRRLHDAGVPFVAMAGIGIWHEPFYAKLGSWHAYYELRNMFILAACHRPDAHRLITRIASRWIVAELLMFRYQRAALFLRAVEDFLAGPELFARDPRALHASLMKLRAAYPARTARREQVVPGIVPPVGPRTRLQFNVGVSLALAAEYLRRDGTGRTIAIEPPDHLWFRVLGAGAVVVREPWEVDHPIYTRDRATYRALLHQAMRLLRRLRRNPGVVTAWRKAHPDFTSEVSWRRYLGMTGDGVPRAGKISGLTQPPPVLPRRMPAEAGPAAVQAE